MIATLTLNPAIDLTVTVEGLELGASHRVPASRRRAGGKGVNVARVLHGQHLPVLVVAPVGGSAGAEFAAELESAGLPHALVPAAAETRLSTSIFEADSGRATLFNEYGNPLARETVDSLKDLLRELPDLGCLVISGSLPAGTEAGVMAEFVALARDAGVPTVVDTSGPALLAAARAGATLLKPNQSELAAATAQADPWRGIETLLGAGAHHVVVTAGAKGMLSTDGVVARAAVPPSGISGNPTGAGDAATAAFALALTESGTSSLLDPAVLARAAAWSASAVLTPVAGELGPWRDLLDDIDVHTHSSGEGDSECPW